MKTAKLSNTTFGILVIPTLFRYQMLKDLHEVEGQKVCEIGYEIVAEKWKKPATDETEEQLIDFSSPVLFDSGRKLIPYQLYLLIEQYRLEQTEELLEQINLSLQEFVFENSLEGFVIQVSELN